MGEGVGLDSKNIVKSMKDLLSMAPKNVGEEDAGKRLGNPPPANGLGGIGSELSTKVADLGNSLANNSKIVDVQNV